MNRLRTVPCLLVLLAAGTRLAPAQVVATIRVGRSAVDTPTAGACELTVTAQPADVPIGSVDSADAAGGRLAGKFLDSAYAIVRADDQRQICFGVISGSSVAGVRPDRGRGHSEFQTNVSAGFITRHTFGTVEFRTKPLLGPRMRSDTLGGEVRSPVNRVAPDFIIFLAKDLGFKAAADFILKGDAK